MKKLRSTIAVILCILMAMSVMSMSAAATLEPGKIKILSYNVAGLPIGLEVPVNQADIGRYINSNSYDLVALQEDFTFHEMLDKEITNYPYKTVHTGGIPGGDGMNVYSKTPIYNEKRTEWEVLSGVIDGGSDELTPKGILYTVIELEEGYYLDFYVIHADAYGDADSVDAREKNFNQLAEMLEARTVDRPVIVAGDFNTYLHTSNMNSTRGIVHHFVKKGYLDAWVECHNHGDYNDYSEWIDKYGAGYESTIGVWDSIERALFKDGGGVDLTITKLEYLDLTGTNGKLSDHPALELEFTYEITGEQDKDDLNIVKEKKNQNIFRFVWTLIKDLFKILSDWDALMALLGINK